MLKLLAVVYRLWRPSCDNQERKVCFEDCFDTSLRQTTLMKGTVLIVWTVVAKTSDGLSLSV